jgi:hypothetical protein
MLHDFNGSYQTILCKWLTENEVFSGNRSYYSYNRQFSRHLLLEAESSKRYILLVVVFLSGTMVIPLARI